MSFYIYAYSKTRKVVEAKNRDEAKIKLCVSHKDMQNYVSLATEKEIEELLLGKIGESR